jgi:hypothetical protein
MTALVAPSLATGSDTRHLITTRSIRPLLSSASVLNVGYRSCQPHSNCYACADPSAGLQTDEAYIPASSRRMLQRSGWNILRNSAVPEGLWRFERLRFSVTSSPGADWLLASRMPSSGRH